MRLSRLPRKRGAEYMPAAAGARRPMAGILLYASVLVLALAYVSRHARAEGAPQAFAIAAQSLEGALTELAEEAGVQLLFRTELVEGLVSPGLSGRYTSEEALGKLLQGTGFTYRRDAVGTLTLERTASPPPEPLAQATPPPEPEEEIVTLPEMTVTGSPIDDKSYNPPNATTATKTDTPIMETPVSIQVVPQQVLQDQQVIRFSKAIENVSGVYSRDDDGTQAAFVIRGFEVFTYLVDGARTRPGFSLSAPRDTANLEQIEVLKGLDSIL